MLFGEAKNPLGVAALLEAVCHWGGLWGTVSVHFLFTLCLVLEGVLSQLPAPLPATVPLRPPWTLSGTTSPNKFSFP